MMRTKARFLGNFRDLGLVFEICLLGVAGVPDQRRCAAQDVPPSRMSPATNPFAGRDSLRFRGIQFIMTVFWELSAPAWAQQD